MDSRSGKMFRELPHALEELRCRHIPYRILFLEASAEVLLRRYKETRRRHPLLDECDGCLEDAIREERRLLKPIGDAADYIIDTTSLSPSQLRGRIVTIFEGETTPMLISCQSFGFRNGLPQDADLHALLRMLLGECSAAFEALPVLQDVELLRNILYSGVWLRYDAAMKKLKIGRSAE